MIKTIKSYVYLTMPDRGILVFENTSEVIQSENILKAEGWKIRVMGPPPEIRSGCDLMIRAANMKLTIDKETKNIVNIYGGGCPDVPYLAQEMVGKTLAVAPAPRKIGHTLCGYALQLAYEEMIRRCSL